MQYHPPDDPDGDDWFLDITVVRRDRQWWYIWGAALRASYAAFLKERASRSPEALQAARLAAASDTGYSKPDHTPRSAGMLLARLPGWGG